MVDVKRKLVIIHPPKTGGQAVQSVLGLGRHWITGRGVWRHDTIKQIREKMPETTSWETAILVRDPYDRLESFYHYTKQGSTNSNSPVREVILSYPDFKTFVENVDFQALFAYAPGLRPEQATLMPMCWYARTGDPNSFTTVLRLETVEFDLMKLLSRPVSVPVANKGRYERSEWTDLMRGRVYKAFKEDFYVFHYPAGV